MDLRLTNERDGAELAVTVAAAHQLGVFRALRDGSLTATELADRVRCDRRAAGILLAALHDMDLLTRDNDRYALTADARRQLADPDGPDYAGGGLPLWLDNLRAWTELPRVMRTGDPLPTESRERTREELASYMAAMAAGPPERIRRVVTACLARVPNARTMLDLGGGPGHMARGFAEAGLSATLFDQPEIVDFVRDEYRLEDAGVTTVAGDFLSDALPGPFDIVLASNITHIYPPDTNRSLLRKIASIVRPGGGIGVADFVRGHSPRAARFALVMLLRTEGGNTYSEADYESWLSDAGFHSMAIEDVDVDRQIVTAVLAPRTP